MQKESVSIVLCGEAGQGLQTVEKLIPKILKREGFNVFTFNDYMSRVRGGSNYLEIRVSSKPLRAFVERIDLLIPLNEGKLDRLNKRISKDTLFVGTENVNCKNLGIDLTKLSGNLPGKLFMNTLAIGFISGLFNVDKELMKREIENYFADKDKELINNNVSLSLIGYRTGNDLLMQKKVVFDIKKNNLKNQVILSGNEAIGLGCLAGDCKFIPSYPMTPGTGLMTFMAQHAKKMGIIVEQSEDEIAAINMALGAWYAGARSIVTTSGGGYDLMQEGMSLAGITESPLVVHLAQRPGPATGLPTRTEQGDLNLALYSGHGEFPRIILAPGNFEDACLVSQLAFDLADKYQVPVFILTDQAFLDQTYNLNIEVKNKVQDHFVKTLKDYKRYDLKNTISPRGIPGFGEGLIGVDSDEHDEEGHITENFDVRIKMMNKRMKKLELIKKEVIKPEIYGDKNYKKLIVCWGSSFNAVKEAVENLGKGYAVLYYKQVYPLHQDTEKILKKAKKIYCVENNFAGQFADLINKETGMKLNKILKYNGLPFSVEELTRGLK